jgi:solute carrier family 13 (sodium-dependent dicarboxylate transporter), member 2/3/5
MQEKSKLIGLFLGPLAFIIIINFLKLDGLSDAGLAVLASTLWIAIWWMTEAIPIAVTSLLPIVLFPLTGALDLETTATSYGDKYIFLYIGGFILAIAIEQWNLHKRIALNIIKLIGTNVSSIILGFMVATGFLSMWISNTATAVMMLPIGMAIVAQLKDNPNTIADENLIFGKALMLSIAYSASIGGMATLVGTPTNLIFVGVVEKTYGVEITFLQWLKFGLPITIILLILTWLYLTRVAFVFKQKAFPGGKEEIQKQINSLGKITYEEKSVLVVFVIVALAWISRSFLEKFVPALDDTVIAMIGSMALFLLPTRNKEKSTIMDWDSAVKLPWGILLLFGGGLALAEGFKITGLAEWVGSQMTVLQGMHAALILIIVVGAVNFLTEITSNVATTSMILPILVPIATSLGVHPYLLMAGATIAASCAFMLPVATPPNALVFASGYLRISDMVKTGLALNFISIAVVSAIAYFFLPYLWGF